MCERWEGLGVTPRELMTPGTVVMVPVGQAAAIINGGPCIVAWATVIGPATEADAAVFTDPSAMYWLEVHNGPGVTLPQMYRADQILGVPALGLKMAEGTVATDRQLTPGQLANLDRAHASADEDLDDLIGQHRPKVHEHGPVRAAALLALHLVDQPHGVVAGFASLAVTRLAEYELEIERNNHVGPPDVEPEFDRDEDYDDDDLVDSRPIVDVQLPTVDAHDPREVDGG